MMECSVADANRVQQRSIVNAERVEHAFQPCVEIERVEQGF